KRLISGRKGRRKPPCMHLRRSGKYVIVRADMSLSWSRRLPGDGKRGSEKSPEDGKLAEAIVDGVQDAALVERRRDQICEAALELFLEKGFASTTIRDICSRSGVN